LAAPEWPSLCLAELGFFGDALVSFFVALDAILRLVTGGREQLFDFIHAADPARLPRVNRLADLESMIAQIAPPAC
jgi:hypothetical protein